MDTQRLADELVSSTVGKYLPKNLYDQVVAAVLEGPVCTKCGRSRSLCRWSAVSDVPGFLEESLDFDMIVEWVDWDKVYSEMWGPDDMFLAVDREGFARFILNCILKSGEVKGCEFTEEAFIQGFNACLDKHKDRLTRAIVKQWTYATVGHLLHDAAFEEQIVSKIMGAGNKIRSS